MADVRAAFVYFCGGDSLMDKQRFVTFCKDCDLVGEQLTVTEIDHIFSKAVPYQAISRKINFNQFVMALQQLAAKKDCTFSVLASLINEGRERAQAISKLSPTLPLEPRSSTSSPASTKYSSSRSTPRSTISSASDYVTICRADFERICEQLRTNELLGPPAATALEEVAGISLREWGSSVGNMAKGLRNKMLDARELDVQALQHKLDELRDTMAQKDKTIDLLKKEVSELPSDRRLSSPGAIARRQSMASNPPEDHTEQRASKLSLKLSQRRISCSSRSRRLSTQLERNPIGLLHETYTSLSNGPDGVQMNTFVQHCRDAHLFDKAFTSKDAQKAFADVARKDEYGYFGIEFAQFKSALELVAERKGVDVTKVSDAVCLVGEEQHQMVHWQS
jgi:hypothetical protein